MKSIKVLYIEENASDVALVMAYLEQNPFAEFDVEVVQRIQDVAPLTQKEDFDLVLFEPYLSETQGLNSLNALGALELRLPVVIYTSESDNDIVLTYLQKGVQDVIDKNRTSVLDLGKSLVFAYERFQREKEISAQAEELKKLSTAAEQSANVIVITDKSGRIEFVNHQFELTTGYSRKEAIGNNPRILNSGYHDKAFFDEMWQVLNRGEVWKGKLKNKRKDGSLLWEATTITPILNDRLEITHFIASKDDITSDIIKSEELAKSYQRLERSHEVAKIGSFEFDYELNKYSHSCPHVEHILQMDIASFFELGNEIEKVDCDFVNTTQIERCKKGEKTTCVYHLPGLESYVEVNVEPLFEGDLIKAASGTVQDVTETIQTQFALTMSRDQYRSFFDNEFMGMLHIDDKGNVLNINQALLDIYGLKSRSEYPSNILTVEWYGIHRDGSPIMKDEVPFVRCLSQGEKVKSFIHGFPVSEDRFIWLDMSVSPIMSDNNRVTGAILMFKDITSLIEAEDQIRNEESKLRLAHQIGKTGVIEIELNKGEFIWSDEACDIFEIPHKNGPVLSDDFPKYIFPEDYEKVKSIYAEDLINDRDGQIEYSIKTPKGSIKHLASSYTFIDRDSKKGDRRVLCVVHDVTELKSAELMAQKRRDHYRAFFDNEVIGILHIDKEGNLINLNEAMLKIHGMSSKDEYPKNIFKVEWNAVLSDGRPASIKDFPAFIATREGKVVSDVIMGLPVKGQTQWLDLGATPIKNNEGEIQGAILTIREVTEAVETQLALKDRQDKLILSHQIGKIGISEYHFANNEYYWSAELCDIFEIPPLKGHVPLETFEKYIIPEDVERVMSTYKDDLANLRDGQIGYTIKTPKGNIKHVVANYHFIDRDQPEQMKVIGVIQDVTELKLAELKASASEQMLDNILKSIRDKIIIFNEKDEFINFFQGDEADPPMVDPDLAYGKSFYQVFPQQLHRSFKKALRKVRKNRNKEIVNFVTKIGTEKKHYEAHLSFVPDTPGHVSILARNITAQYEAKKQIEQLVSDLAERVKESQTLQKVTELGTQEFETQEAYFEKICALIPPGFLFPELTKVRITFNEKRFGSKRLAYRNTLQEPIYLNGKQKGLIEVGIPVKDVEGRPIDFLEEEWGLLHSIAESISLVISSRYDRQRLLRSEAKYRGIVKNLREGLMRLNAEGEVLEVNDFGANVFEQLGFTNFDQLNFFVYAPYLKNMVDLLEPNKNGLNYLSDQNLKINGPKTDMVFRTNFSVFYQEEKLQYIEGTFIDVTKQYYLEEYRKASIKIFEASQDNYDRLIQDGIDVAVDLLNSSAGFYHMVDEEAQTIKLVQWSMGTKEVCEVPHLMHNYKIEEAGIWVECIKTKKPVVHNDYASLKKKGGVPKGHFTIIRDLEVPVIQNGKVVAIVGVGNKETEYTKLDEELLNSFAHQLHSLVQKTEVEKDYINTLENFRQSQEVGRIGSWEYDMVYNKTWWSDVMFDIYGLAKEDGIPEENWIELTHPEDREEMLSAFAKAAESGKYEMEYRLIRSNGEIRYVYAQSHIIYKEDGQPEKHIGILQDITEQKQYESRIEDQRRLFESMVDTLPGFVYQLNSQGKIVFVSDQVEEVLGFKAQDLIGAELTEEVGSQFGFGVAEDFADQYRNMRRALQEKSGFNGVSRMRKLTGEVIWVSSSGAYEEMDGEGMIQGYITDITEQVQQDEERMSAVMKASDGEKARISKEIHDGLQQTLTIAALNLEFVKKEQEKLSEQIREKFELGWKFLKKGMDDTRSIAHRLMPKAIEDFGLVSVVKEMVNDLNRSTDIEFEFVTNMDGHRIKTASATIIYKLIQESINNIMKHAKAKNVTIQYLSLGSQLQLIIEDDGVGFEPNQLEKNSGFGLASMKSRATALGADFILDSTPGHGTTIILDIPLDDKLKYYE